MGNPTTPIRVLGARPYPEVRALCHAVKASDPAALRLAAVQLAGGLPGGCVLIPVPGRSGVPGYTLRLSELIRDEMSLLGKSASVEDAIRTNPHPSLNEAKHKGIPPADIPITAAWKDGRTERRIARLITEKGALPVLVDNVVDTGHTARSCALPFRSIGIEEISVAAIGDTFENQ